MTRPGPRPLPLHLAAALSLWTSGIAAWPISSAASPGSKPSSSEAAELRAAAAALGRHPAERVAAALSRETRRRAAAFATGLERYRAHPYRRALPDAAVAWQEGTTRLLDYAPGGGRPVLVVPSLVNRAYVLDLSAERSLLRWLAARGFRPFLVEWGRPDPDERRFTLTDIVAGRLDRALDAARARTGGGRLALAGYCMGGTLAAALAERRPSDFAGAVFLATPWSFHADPPQATAAAAALAALLPVLMALGELPVDALQTLFMGLDPLTALRKFTAFARLDPASPEAERFVALEDWLNDGIPLAGPIAAECLGGWYGANTPAAGRWLVAGRPVEAARIAVPSLHLIPAQDRIVPPGSARALADAMPGSERIEPPLGHIGMVVAGGAEARVWRPLADWLSARL